MLVGDLQAILLAAGRGTRLNPFTTHCPKCLIPIQGKPLLEYWLCMLNRANYRRVLVNTHAHKTLVESYVSQSRFSDWVFNGAGKQVTGNGRHNKSQLRMASRWTLLSGACG